jgi:hypothetical protein
MSQIIPGRPFDYVVFGGTGDLAERKLLPALYHRQMAGQLTDPTRIIGASRSEMSHDEYRNFARDALKEHLKDGRISTTTKSRPFPRAAVLRCRRRANPKRAGRAEGEARRGPATGCGRSISPSGRRCSATSPSGSARTGW